MNYLKGFISIAALADNTPGVTAAFGELSALSATFSKEKGYYANVVSTDVELVAFSAKDDLDAHYVLNAATRDHVLAVAQWVYGQYAAQNIPLQVNAAAFQAAIEAELNVNVTNIVLGTLTPGAGATYNMPEYVQWVFTDVSDGNKEHTVKIWFIDSAFQAQYGEYEISIIPPTTPYSIDGLYNDTAVVAPTLAAVTPAIIVDQISTVVGATPATIIKTVQYTWFDPNPPNSTLTTTWTLVIWGAAGDNSDNIIAAIRDYIADNTTLLLTDWQGMFPDLYNETEFAFIPLWDYIASPETQLDYGVYSPTVNPADMKAIALAFTPSSYGLSFNLGTHLDLNLNLTQSVYRSLLVLVVGYPGNAGGIVQFAQKYPDYIAVSTESGDYQRMTVATQNFVTVMVELLNEALDVTPATSPSVGFSKVTRGGKLYVTKMHEGVLYLALTRYSYEA